MGIKIKIAVSSHHGSRKRNEDNFYTGRKTLNDKKGLYSLSHKISRPSICAVCDGMGGLSDGQLASQNVVTYLKDYCSKGLCKSFKKNAKLIGIKNVFVWIDNLMNDINKYINMLNGGSKECGSTLAMLYLDEEKIYAANIGDSSIYVFKDGQFEKISMDHTYHASILRSGIKSKDEIGGKNILTQYLGMPMDSIVLEPHIVSLDYASMIMLMCSDGLIERLEECEISNICSKAKCRNLKFISKKLIKCAIDKGTKDNITVMLIQIKT